MDANNQRPGFILVYRLWRGLADMGTYLDESLLSGKYGLIYAEDAKQLQKEALPKEVYQGLCLKNDKKNPILCPIPQIQQHTTDTLAS